MAEISSVDKISSSCSSSHSHSWIQSEMAAVDGREVDRAEMGGEKKKRKAADWAPLPMSPAEVDLIWRMHRLLGDRWSLISKRLQNRSEEEVKRCWLEIEKKIYRKTKLFKPKCLRPSPSFKFPYE